MAKAKPSGKYQLNLEDLKKLGYNAFIFAIPALLVLIADGIKLLPQDASWGIIALFIANRATELLRAYKAGR